MPVTDSVTGALESLSMAQIWNVSGTPTLAICRPGQFVNVGGVLPRKPYVTVTLASACCANCVITLPEPIEMDDPSAVTVSEYRPGAPAAGPVNSANWEL